MLDTPSALECRNGRISVPRHQRSVTPGWFYFILMYQGLFGCFSFKFVSRLTLLPGECSAAGLASRATGRGSHNQGWHRGRACCPAWVTWPDVQQGPELGSMLCAAILKPLTDRSFIFSLHQTAMKKPQPRPHFLPWLLFLLWPMAIRMGGSETTIGSESTAMNAIKGKTTLYKNLADRKLLCK